MTFYTIRYRLEIEKFSGVGCCCNCIGFGPTKVPCQTQAISLALGVSPAGLKGCWRQEKTYVSHERI